MHVHAECEEGEAKNELQKIIEEKSGEITKAWKKHFKQS